MKPETTEHKTLPSASPIREFRESPAQYRNGLHNSSLLLKLQIPEFKEESKAYAPGTRRLHDLSVDEKRWMSYAVRNDRAKGWSEERISAAHDVVLEDLQDLATLSTLIP